MLASFLDKMQRKFGRFALPNLMNIVVGGMAIVFVFDLIFPADLYNALAFSMPGIREGQLWRLIMFIFLPPNTSLIFILFSLYFYWMIGSGLEREWGAFKFNIYYLTGIVGTLLSGLITGYAVNTYINMSLFFAFAILYPDFQITLFFLVPIKMKWLALANGVLYLAMLVLSDWQGRVAIVISLANLILFFGPQALGSIKQAIRRYRWRRGTRRD